MKPDVERLPEEEEPLSISSSVCVPDTEIFIKNDDKYYPSSDSAVDEISESEVVSSCGSVSSASSAKEVVLSSKKALMMQVNAKKVRVTVIDEFETVKLFLQNGGGNRNQNEEEVGNQMEEDNSDQMGEENGIYSAPFSVALIKCEFFVFGSEVKEYADRRDSDPYLKSKSVFWDVGVLLQKPKSTKKIPVMVNSKVFHVPNELLAGLFFSYLKSMAEKRWDTDECINKVILCVPLWYGSFQRQRLKDTAKIAGFEDITVVNEISTVALLHISSKDLAPGTTPKHLLVLSENSRNVDLAFYSCTSGRHLKMVACTGNLLKEPYKELKEEEDTNALKYVLKNLIKELDEKLPERMSQFSADVLLLCEDTRWKPILEEETNRSVTVYKNLGSPIVGPLKKNDCDPPRVHHFQLSEDRVEDLHPFGVFRSDEIYGKWCVPMLEKDLSASNEIAFKSVTIYPTTVTGIYQKTLSMKNFFVGTVHIPPTLYYQYPKMEIKCSLTKEGIINLESVAACSENEEVNRILKAPEEYRWTPTNLTVQQREQCVGDLKEIMMFSENYKEKVFGMRETLWDKCTLLAEHIWNKGFKRGTNRNQRDTVDKRVNHVLKALRNGRNPLIEFNVSTLKRWTAEIDGYLGKYFS